MTPVLQRFVGPFEVVGQRDRLSDERRNLMRQISDLKSELEAAPDPAQLTELQADLDTERSTSSSLMESSVV